MGSKNTKFPYYSPRKKCRKNSKLVFGSDFSGKFRKIPEKNRRKKSHKNGQKIPIFPIIAVRFFSDFSGKIRKNPEKSGKIGEKIPKKIAQKVAKNTNFRYYSRSIFFRFFPKFPEKSENFRKNPEKIPKKNRTKMAKKYQISLL